MVIIGIFFSFACNTFPDSLCSLDCCEFYDRECRYGVCNGGDGWSDNKYNLD